LLMLRRDRLEPTSKKSRMDTDDPNLTNPHTATDDPTRLKLLIDRVEPRTKKSKIDNDEPSL